ncbi:hypothetical protein AB0M80_39370 [Amycolatopsis sp. NPDC051045]|uniref:hypothetical protein n=1 Tax=Amycolatopsis sp. NPDC051045 TaxID=3156922 RepID=UPI003431CC35
MEDDCGAVDDGDARDLRDYERFRPRSGGIDAVAKLIELARRHGTAAHVLHVSSREEADLLTAAGATGLPVIWEVTAHGGLRERRSPECRQPLEGPGSLLAPPL